MNKELEKVEVSIDVEELAIAKMEALDELSKSKAFNLIIGEGYFTEEAARTVSLLADPTMQGDVDQRELMSSAKAIGHLRQYLIQIKRNGMIMADGLEDNQELADELRAEA